MSPLNLPFTLETNVDFDQAAVTGELRLQIVPAVPRPDPEPSKEVLEVYVEAVSLNLFFADSGIATCQPAPSKTDDPYVWDYTVQNVPVQSLWVLLGLWAQTAWAGDEIQTVKISFTPTGQQTPRGRRAERPDVWRNGFSPSRPSTHFRFRSRPILTSLSRSICRSRLSRISIRVKLNRSATGWGFGAFWMRWGDSNYRFESKTTSRPTLER